MAELTPEQLELLEKAESITRKSIESRKEELQIQKDIAKELGKAEEVRRLELQTERLKVEAAQAALDQAIKAKEDTADLVATLRQVTVEYEKQRKALSDQEEFIKTIDADADQVLTSFFGITSQTKQFAKTLEQGGGLANVLKARMSKVKESLTLSNIQAKLIQKSFENINRLGKSVSGAVLKPAKESLDLVTNIERATKRQDEFRLAAREVGNTTGAEIASLSEKFMRLGQETDGTTEDFIKINKTLFNTSRLFRELKNVNDSSRESLEKTAQTLERRFNVSATDVANTADILGQTFGKSAVEISQLQEELVVTADVLGLDAKNALNEFAQQSNNLAKFNVPDLVGSFTKLSAISQKTGISINSVMGALEKLSTFQGALDAASRLNAVFSTTISGLELMDTINIEGPVAGFIKLREQIELSGLEIEDLNFAQMRAFTSAIGLSAEEVKQLGRVSTDELQNLANQGLSIQQVQTKLSEGRKEAQTTEEKIAENIDNSTTAMNNLGKSIDGMTRSISDAISGFETMLSVIGFLGPAVGAMLLSPLNKAVTRTIPSLISGLANANAVASGTGLTSLGGAASGATAGGVGLAAGGAAVAAGGAIGTGIGLGINELLRSGGFYEEDEEIDYNIFGRNIFAPGQNYISQNTAGVMGEAGIETYTQRTNKILNAGSSLTKSPSGGSSNQLQMTVNFVTPDGKVLDTKNISKTLDENGVKNIITQYLKDSVSLA
tara:strand:- start:5929 stop:8109 length:2181 start_codon:yes stop_codon:yes gene_type:complete